MDVVMQYIDRQCNCFLITECLLCKVFYKRRQVMKTRAEQNGQRVRVFLMGENQCVWMKAGVVNFKSCENAFDCTSCYFDKEMSRNSWREVMRKPHLQKECRHMLTGRVQFKLCSHNYECKDCAYDQMLDAYDQLLGQEDLPIIAAAQINKVAGYTVSIPVN